jgi:DNA-binding CsgD family transcriptional regulator
MGGASQTAAATSWPLVGRELELDELVDALDDVSCDGVALVGQAGVGKTRLGRQLAEIAASRRLSTISVRASRSASNVPLAALAPLFAALNVAPNETSNHVQVVARAIERRAAEGRLVIFVDDAHELDDASAAVLDQVVGRSGTFVVLTVRTGDQRLDAVLDLLKDQQIIRVSVGPLHDEDIRKLVTVALGGPVDGAALQALVTASDGNVLFLRELLLGAIESGALQQRRGLFRLKGSLVGSPRLRDLIDHRLRGLSETEREAVELVALGEPLELSLLGELVPEPIVERLEGQAVLDSVGGPLGLEVRLAHPLYGEVVRQHLSPVRRGRLCRSLADALERRGELLEPDALRAGIWHLDGGGGSPELLLSAARAAFRTEDFSLAGRLARAAWRKGQQIDAALLLADSLVAAGSAEEIEDVLATATARATTNGELTSIATRRASSLFVWLDRVDDAERILEEAATRVTDPACRRAIDAQRADSFLLTGNVARTIEIGEPLLAISGDSAFAQASRDIGVALAFAGRTAEALRHTEAALLTVHEWRETDAVTAVGVFIVARAVALGEAGRLAESVATAEAGYEAAIEHRNADGQAWCAAVLALSKVTQGRLVEAEHLFRETATAFHELGHPGRRWGLGGIALAAGQRGDRQSAAAAVVELDETAPTSTRLMDVHIERGRAWAAVAAGDIARARSILWDAVELAERWGQHASAVAALHDLVRIGEGPQAGRRMHALKGCVDGELVVARTAFATAASSANPKAAAMACDRFEACGALLFAAEAATLERRLALESGQSRAAAAAEARATRLLEQCQDARTPGTDEAKEPARISQREREVATLAMEGLANREIAERLFVSTRTIENHLQRVYVKLGVTSRTELTAILRRQSSS